MATLNPQAVELNDIIKKNNPTVYELLSQRGKRIFFPKKGILAQGAEAKGKEINATLGMAYEDDGSPMILPSISDNIKLDNHKIFPYAPSYGLKPLREKWKECQEDKNPSLKQKETSLPVVTCALTHGLSMAGYLFVDEEEPIIVADLFWGNYNLVFGNAYNADIKKFNFFKDGVFDIDNFKAVLNDGPIGKKIVVLNFPNNPSGYTPTIEATEQIKAALHEAAEAGNKLILLLDDAYFGLQFADDIPKEALFAEIADLHENLLAVKLDGITKEDYAWGFRVGFVTFGIKGGNRELYGALEDKLAGAVRGSISNAPHLSQSLILEALTSPNYTKEKQRNEGKIRERYEKVKEILENHPEYNEYFEALPFNSGYFMCVRIKCPDAEVVRQTLLEKFSTGLIAIANKNLLRVAFASTPTPKLEKLFNNIYLACKECA